MLLPFNSPADIPSGGTDTGELTKYDIEEELLKDDDPEVIALPEPKVDGKVDDDEDDKEVKEPEVDELEELEKELKGPTDEQLELMTPARRKDILTAFPELFKKFPYLETAYYRDQKFTEFFPTFKDAESAAASAKEYSELQDRLKAGDFEGIINLAKTDDQAFARLVDNYLPTLAKVDRQAYDHILGNTIRHTIKAMVGEADRSQSAALKTAATILNQFVFGSSNFEEPRPLSHQFSPEQNRGQTELEMRERQFEERRFNIAQNDIADKVNNSIKATISNNIDPKGTMTDYVKNAAVNAAMTNVEQLIMKDTRFRTIIDRLWQEAARNDYNKASMDKIKSACVSKARTVLEPVIKSARNEALKGMNKRVKDDDDKEEPRDKRERRVPNNSDRGKGSKVPAGMNSLDYLMSDED